jgi:hypothetical protein
MLKVMDILSQVSNALHFLGLNPDYQVIMEGLCIDNVIDCTGDTCPTNICTAHSCTQDSTCTINI